MAMQTKNWWDDPLVCIPSSSRKMETVCRPALLADHHRMMMDECERLRAETEDLLSKFRQIKYLNQYAGSAAKRDIEDICKKVVG